MKTISRIAAVILLLLNTASAQTSIMELNEKAKRQSSVPEVPEFPAPAQIPRYDPAFCCPWKSGPIAIADSIATPKTESDKQKIERLTKSNEEKDEELARLYRNELTIGQIKLLKRYQVYDSVFKSNIIKYQPSGRRPGTDLTGPQQYQVDSIYEVMIHTNEKLIIANNKILTRIDTLKKHIDSIQQNHVAEINKIKTTIDSEAETINDLFSLLESTYDSYNQLYKKNKEVMDKMEKEKSNVPELQTQPSITGLTGNDMVVPSISLLGSSNFSQDNFASSIKLFVAGQDAETKDSVKRADQLFIPEASTFGITMEFNWKFAPDEKAPSQNRILLNTQFGFYKKQLQFSDQSTFNMHILHARFGLEIAPVKNYVSLYFNVNGIAPLTNMTGFHRFAPQAPDQLFFLDYGTKFYTTVSADKKLSLIVDLNFVGVNSSVRRAANTTDYVIPAIRFGIKKDIN